MNEPLMTVSWNIHTNMTESSACDCETGCQWDLCCGTRRQCGRPVAISPQHQATSGVAVAYLSLSLSPLGTGCCIICILTGGDLPAEGARHLLTTPCMLHVNWESPLAENAGGQYLAEHLGIKEDRTCAIEYSD